MALAREPKLLLLDEPTAGMSPQERRATGELLAPIKQRCSMLIVEHDLDFIKDICDTLTVLDQGQVVDERPDARSCRTALRSRRSTSPCLTTRLLASRGVVHLLRHQPGVVRRIDQGRLARRRRHSRTQWRGQDHAAEDAGGRPEVRRAARSASMTSIRSVCAPNSACAAGIGHVPQEHGVFGGLTVKENLLVGAMATPTANKASTKSSRCFRGWASALRNRLALFPAASARCSPSVARCSLAPIC